MIWEQLRSEAHYAAMLFRDLESESSVRQRFLSLVEARQGFNIGRITGVFVEPAPFRDSWKRMNYSQRLDLVQRLLAWTQTGIEPKQITSLFKGGKGANSLRSPASWDMEELCSLPPELLRLRFIFRARPDLLVITEKAAIWLELKVEGGTNARNAKGYYQPETQKHIAELAPLVIPELDGLVPLNLIIRRHPGDPDNVITWADLVPEWKSPILMQRAAWS